MTSRSGSTRARSCSSAGRSNEPLLRIDSTGVWANADSPTATGDKLVSATRHGWVHLSGGNTVTWHDHRLAPPPSSAVGPVGRFVIPIDVNGAPAAISGTFFRVARPALWPWLAGGARPAGAILAAIRRRPLRGPLTIGLGVAAGLAALVEVTTFAVSDAPTGGVAWLQIVTALLIAAVLAGLLVRLRGRSRVHAAGVVGAIAAAVSLSSTPVFWHGVVISALPAVGARAVCGFAILAGVAAACLSFLRDFDEPVRATEAAAAMSAFLTAIVLLAHPSVRPWPIGPGPRYTPPPRPASVSAARPVASLRCGPTAKSLQVHLELFVDRRVVVVPAGIGLARAGCAYPVRTLTPGGVVDAARGRRLTLGDLFRVWGEPLGRRRLVSFSSPHPLRAYVDGRLVHGPAAAIPLRAHAEIVLELGPYVAPHPFFLFPGGDS